VKYKNKKEAKRLLFYFWNLFWQGTAGGNTDRLTDALHQSYNSYQGQDRLQGHVSGRHLESALPYGKPGMGQGK
jgi:hypothetical protein